jgi:hypothetical protein
MIALLYLKEEMFFEDIRIKKGYPRYQMFQRVSIYHFKTPSYCIEPPLFRKVEVDLW